MNLAFPKPKKLRKSVRTTYPKHSLFVFTDGREVCNLNTKAGADEYQRRKRVMWERQGKKCLLCGLGLGWADSTFEHQDGRGMGGAKRDDRIEKDGKPYNGVAHLMCNARKGSQSLDDWFEKFQQTGIIP